MYYHPMRYNFFKYEWLVENYRPVAILVLSSEKVEKDHKEAEVYKFFTEVSHQYGPRLDFMWIHDKYHNDAHLGIEDQFRFLGISKDRHKLPAVVLHLKRNLETFDNGHDNLILDSNQHK